MTVFEMVKRDLEEQGLPDSEIAEVVNLLTEDANWRCYLSATRGYPCAK
jgi:hypothetical protein